MNNKQPSKFLKTMDEIDSWLFFMKVKKYSINDNLSVDVADNLILNKKDLSCLPVQFNRVEGYFDCSENKLTSMKGTPRHVNGDFCIGRNLLTSLKDGPEVVSGYFLADSNHITSLEHLPIVGTHIFMSNNELTSLKHSPKTIYGGFICNDNPLLSLEHCPEEILGDFECRCKISLRDNLQYLPKIVADDFMFMAHNEFPNLKEHQYDDGRINIYYQDFIYALFKEKLDKELPIKDNITQPFKI